MAYQPLVSFDTNKINKQWGIAGSNKFGLQKSGFVPEGVGAGAASKNVYDENFDFEKFDYNYNPWGEGSEAQAAMESFNMRLKANSQEAMQEFARLKRDAFGYQYESPLAQETTSRRDAFWGNQRGTGGGYIWGTKDDIDYGRGDSFDSSSTKDKYGRTVLQEGVHAKNISRDRGGQNDFNIMTHRVAGKQLNKVDEYMLWRYDVATTQIAAAGLQIGSGETELINDDWRAAAIDKTVAGSAGKGQVGPVTAGAVGRQERQSGKQQFTKGIQL